MKAGGYEFRVVLAEQRERLLLAVGSDEEPSKRSPILRPRGWAVQAGIQPSRGLPLAALIVQSRGDPNAITGIEIGAAQ